jgi:hypothetical protein
MKKFAALLVLLCAPVALAQAPSEMDASPYFEQILKNDSVRVFLLTLDHGQQVMAAHPHNFLMVTLQDCEVVLWPEGKSDVTSFRLNRGDARFIFGGPAGGIRNEQTQPFRALFVEFLDPKVTTFGYQSDGSWGYGVSSVGAPVDPHTKFSNGISLGAATLTDVQLLPNDTLEAPDKPKPELFIPVSDVDLKEGRNLRITNSSGEATWIPLGRKSTLENEGAEPARFLLVDFTE